MADGASFTASGSDPDPHRGRERDALPPRAVRSRRGPRRDRRVELTVLARRNAVNKDLSNTGGPTTPVEIKRLEQINWFPAILAVLLTMLALVAVGHALVSSVRRRRRELALLKTIGFDRRQVGATVAWQATTLASVGLVIGIPVGLVVGPCGLARRRRRPRRVDGRDDLARRGRAHRRRGSRARQPDRVPPGSRGREDPARGGTPFGMTEPPERG